MMHHAQTTCPTWYIVRMILSTNHTRRIRHLPPWHPSLRELTGGRKGFKQFDSTGMFCVFCKRKAHAVEFCPLKPLEGGAQKCEWVERLLRGPKVEIRVGKVWQR